MKMKRLLSFLFVLIVVFATAGTTVEAQDSYVTCDLCGLCQKAGTVESIPQSWESCRQCLYPNQTSDPMYTLAVDPVTHGAPTPMPGRLYTMLGCVQTNLSFTNDGAAASIVNLVLSMIFRVAGGIALLYLIYGAYLIITSQSDPEKLNYGKRTVAAAIVGLIFSLFSVFIVNLLATGVLQLPGFSSGPVPTP